MIAAAVRPADAREAAAFLAECAARRRTVRVQGAGTKSYLGELRATAAALDTTAMSGIVDHVPADLTVTVAAGTRLADVQRALGERGQVLPLDPPHADEATIGGIVASASDGFARGRYGGVRDLLIGTVLALADGSVVRAGGRVVKNVAGYDLNKLIIGSLGTLGIVAEATFKVVPLPPARTLVVVRCGRAADAFSVCDALARTPLRPTALVVDGTRDGWTAYVGAQGQRPQVQRAEQEAGRAAASAGATSAAAADDAPLAPLRDLPAAVTDGALVRASLPLAAQRSFAATAAGLEAFARLVADATTGVVRVHLRGDDGMVVTATDTLLAAATVVGGSARVERRHASLHERLPAWGGPHPGGGFLMKRIKDAFDPVGILEPGRSILG